MIVRVEQENLPHCLSSVAGLLDEIVVVDTGSKDRTREIARAPRTILPRVQPLAGTTAKNA